MAARYITTDLNLKARFDLKPLTMHLEERGFACVGEPKVRGGVWSAVLETAVPGGKLDHELKRLLVGIEGLEGEFRLAWDRCLAREFDLGYECQDDDFSSTTLVKHELVRRIASIGCDIRITIYRDSEQSALNRA